MKSKFLFMLLAVMCSLTAFGMLIAAIRLYLSGYTSQAIWIGIGVIALISVAIFTFRKLLNDVKAGIPIYDERTKNTKMNAAGYSYFSSLYIWLSLLAFQKFFDKDDIMIIGLIGMFISFSISWIILNRRRSFE